MPTRAPRICPSCRRKITGTGPCQTCAQRRPARETAASRGYDAAHRQFRAIVLTRDPWCVLCLRAPATVADHYPYSRRQLVAMGADPNDPHYGRGLCGPCHSSYTTHAQPGGWLRPSH